MLQLILLLLVSDYYYSFLIFTGGHTHTTFVCEHSLSFIPHKVVFFFKFYMLYIISIKFYFSRFFARMTFRVSQQY